MVAPALSKQLYEATEDEVCSGRDGVRIPFEVMCDRVSVIEDGVVQFREISVGTAETLEIFGHLIHEKSTSFERYVLLLDLRDGTAPSSGYREAIVAWIRELSCDHICFVQPKGLISRVAARFLFYRAGFGERVSIHETTENALTKARAFLSAAKQ